MRRIWDCLLLTVNGFAEFITEYKLLPLAIGVLFYAAFRWKKYKNDKINYFLIYSAAAVVLLLVPVTAVFFLVYQTRFYDYGWVWSMAPLTAVIAWGMVTIVFEELPGAAAELWKKYRSKENLLRFFGIVVAVLLLFVCGNQGQFQKVSEEELRQRQIAESILQYMENDGGMEDCIVWGPKAMMQYIRSHNGKIALAYGRDMWDAKAGAYDYEVYSAEEIEGYEWMELLSSSHNLYLLEVEQTTGQIDKALADETHLRRAIDSGVHYIILPSQITAWVERKINAAAGAAGLKVAAVEVAEYTLWMLEK